MATERADSGGITGRRLPLHAICPYLAMFPEGFVRTQVEAHSEPGDWVFDRSADVAQQSLSPSFLAATPAGPISTPLLTASRVPRPNALDERYC